MGGDATITVNGTDVGILGSGAAQWDGTWEERIDGVGQASVTIQDRDSASSVQYGFGNNIVTAGHTTVGWRDVLRLAVGSTYLFSGEVTQSHLSLPPGFPWRRWKLSASDFNSVLDLRYVGVPDGLTWETIDGGETHEAIDPDAHGGARDGSTVQALFAQYANLPALSGLGGPLGDGPFDTSTYVHNWIPHRVMVDPATGESRLRWTNTTLRAALDEIRALAGFPIFCWIDPDYAVHWEAFQSWDLIHTGALPLLSPTVPFTRNAPAIVTDDSPNGTTSVGGRGLDIGYDSTYMPQQAYVSGVTDFIYNGGSTIFQGTGWSLRSSGRRDQVNHFRQVLVDAQTVTDAQKNAVAASYINYGRRARIRGTVIVGRPDEPVDGWRCGQLLRIYDARLPPQLNGHAFPIQRVAGKQVAGQSWREYTLEFGDYPIARFSQKYRSAPQRLATARQPARRHEIIWPTHHLRPSTSYTLVSQMHDRSGRSVRHSGVPVSWSLSVVDGAGAPQSTGSIAAITSVTDQHGRTAATLTTGAATDLHYHVTVTTAAQ